jgi:PilZ domain
MFGKGRATRGWRQDPRRSPRRVVGWESRYVVADRADELWFLTQSAHAACVVQDLSVAGACLELPHEQVSVGDRMVLDLRLADRGGASIRLAGDVRHASVADDGRVLADVEFDGVGNLERALLLRLLAGLEPVERQIG